MVAGFNFVTPSFKNVSGSDIACQDIKLAGDAVIAYGDNLQILDEGGAATEIYLWDGEKWVNQEGVECAKTLAPGEGVLISTLLEGVEVVFSGGVGTDALKLVSVAGFNFVGNATPQHKNAQEITISGDAVIAYGDNLQILDEGGAATEIYLWDGEKWVNQEGVECAKTLAPGEGVLISTLLEGVEINIPPANLGSAQ